jgi:AcrR family transcriptional regulator
MGHHRARAIDAIAAAVDEHGYGQTTVRHVLELSGMSRRTFYEVFENLEECFLAAYDSARDAVLARFGTPTGPEHVEDALQAVLEHLAAHPGFARLLVVEPVVAGPRGLRRHEATMRQLTQRLAHLRTEERQDGDDDLAFEAGVGALHRVIQARIVQGRADELPRLAPALAALLVLLCDARALRVSAL